MRTVVVVVSPAPSRTHFPGTPGEKIAALRPPAISVRPSPVTASALPTCVRLSK
jgi:hypothetical protein